MSDTTTERATKPATRITLTNGHVLIVGEAHDAVTKGLVTDGVANVTKVGRRSYCRSGIFRALPDADQKAKRVYAPAVATSEDVVLTAYSNGEFTQAGTFPDGESDA